MTPANPPRPPASRLDGLPAAAIPRIVATAQALEAGRIDVAERELAGVLAAHPAQPEVLRLHAGIASQRGLHAEALRAMHAAVARRPDDALYQNTLGTVLAEAGAYDDAIAALRRCCALQPALALAWFNLGVLLTRCVRPAEAVATLRQAVALDPSHAPARALLADALRVAGQPQEAASEYRRILAARPWTGMAWWGLADLRTTRFDADDIRQLQAALGDPRASDDDRIATGFALAWALDGQGEFAAALAALARAHALARRRRQWDAAGFAAFTAAVNAAFGEDRARAAETQGSEVIFIVGLPRSGSTLVEQILATHPDVEGAGELPDLPLVIGEESRRRGQPFPHWVADMAAADWHRLGERYLARTAHWRRHRPRFTDKLPNNWYYLDAIRAMLPQARIVLARRDPLETCFSCHRQLLYNNEYSRTFADLAGYWHAFDASARRARERHPAHVHENVLEQLVAEPEARIRALLDACGLAFDPACLAFHENPRAVHSPSATQVRQPLHAGITHAARYGALLDPLSRALGLAPFTA